MNNLVLSCDSIRNRIYFFRGFYVMLDSDLAVLYNVETKLLNRAVKRNQERFPSNFCFQLTEQEYEILRSQNMTLEKPDSLRFQNGTLNNDNLKFQNGTSRNRRGKHRKYLPYAFTEQGVSMLSAVLKSDTAVKVSIQIMNTFVVMRNFISKNAELFARIDSAERKQFEFQIKTEKNFEKSHDRFMIIDDKDVYHIGASLKDLGKKWFAFSKFDKSALMILERLK